MNETLAIKQNKFSNGEIAPSLFGDVAHPKYPSSLRTCLNWLPTPQGALIKRSGFKLVNPVKDGSYAPRLIKFVFSDTRAFLLEFGNLYIRFYRSGQYVGVDGNLHSYGDSYAGGYYELTTPFTTAMLPYLKYAQVGNTITICYGGQVAGVAAVAPQDLTHTTNANTPWAISATPLRSPQGTGGNTGPGINVAAYNAANIYNRGDRATTAAGGTTLEWVAIQDGITGAGQAPPAPPGTLNAAQTGVQGNLYWTPTADASHVTTQIVYVTTETYQRNADGVVFESWGNGFAPVLLRAVLGPDRPLPISVPDRNAQYDTGNYTMLTHRIYRGAAALGPFGLIGEVAASPANTSVPFLDYGQAPDYTHQPPKGTDPFLINGADSFPCVVSYLDQRRLFASSVLLPSALFLSRIGDLYNFDGRNTPGADTDAMLNLFVSSEELEQVRSFVPMRRGLVMTSQGEWAMSGQGGGPVSRSSLDLKRQSAWGSNWLNPIKIGTGVLFNTAKSNTVRDLYPLYGLYSDIWDGQDLSVMARHMLDLHTIKAWDFQSVPYPVVWMVRDDGVMLALTYQHAPASFGQQLTEGIVAWSRHTTGIGSDTFESVCVVPEPPDDAVYAVVRRNVNGVYTRAIERMENPICPASPYAAGVSDVRYGKYVDCAVAYDGHNDALGFTATAALIDSIAVPGSTAPADYAIGKQIKITAAGFVAADAANPYGSGFVFDPENVLGLGAVKAHIVGYTDATHVTAELDVAMTQAQITAWRAGQSGAGAWAIAKGKITAAYLSGYALDTNGPSTDPALIVGASGTARGVICLADGDVQLPDSWAAGVASLTTPAVVIQLGISYNADVALLDAFHPQSEIRNKYKAIKRIGYEVAGARDLWLGKDFANLAQWKQRQVTDAYNVMGLQAGYFETSVVGGFDKNGQSVMRHFQPLPAILTSVLREIRLGDS